MQPIFQPTVSGDIEKLGQTGKDSQTGRHTVRWQPAIEHADQWIKLEYVSAVIFGFADDDIEMESYGAVGYELNGKSFQHTVLFAQGIQGDKSVAQASQAVQLYVPPGAKLYFTAPLFSGSGGPSGGGQLSLTGVYQGA